MLLGMGPRRRLPDSLGSSFHVRDARASGVSASRLRGRDLERPYRGVRALRTPDGGTDPWEAARRDVAWRAQSFAPLLRERQFFSHGTAVALWGAPMTRVTDATIDVTVAGAGSFPRADGVTGHRVQPQLVTTRVRRGLPVSSPASTWAMLGSALSVDQLVVLGDFFCRRWRDGRFRREVGREPLATPEQLSAALDAGRRLGAGRLRAALPLIRCDAWSPRESLTRLALVGAGLPEPSLNTDLYDDFGMFLGCVDLCFEEQRVAVEYQGQHHGAQYAQDVERIERLRAAGWIVIQVTSDLLAAPERLAARVRDALRSRGWRG